MRVAYTRAFGEDCEIRALDTIREFAIFNGLDTDEGYFGFEIYSDIVWNDRGYEVWLPVTAETKAFDGVEFKDVDGGTYAVLTVGDDPENIWPVYMSLFKWMWLSDYKSAGYSSMDKITFLQDGSEKYDIYMPVARRDNTGGEILITPEKGYEYSEVGEWRAYPSSIGDIRTSASRKSDGCAQWTPNINTAGFYSVSIFKPVHENSDPYAKIEIKNAAGSDTQYIDYTDGIPEWVELGIYKFDKGQNGYVRVSGSGAEAFMRTAYVKFRLIEDEKLKNLSDIPGHWAETAVRTLAYKGIISGHEDGTFKPDENILFDEFVKLLVTALGHNIVSRGSGYWAQAYIDKAVELGIIKDSPGENKAVSRLQISQMLENALKNEVPLNTMLHGYDSGDFNPAANMTRAEGAEVIQRLINPNKRIPQFDESGFVKEPARDDGNGVITLNGEKAGVAFGGKIEGIRVMDSGAIGYWLGDGEACWEADVSQAGIYTVEMTYCTPFEHAGEDVIIEAGNSRLTYIIPGTGGWGVFDTVQMGTIELSAGLTTVTMKHSKLITGDYIDLRQLKFTLAAE